MSSKLLSLYYEEIKNSSPLEQFDPFYYMNQID